MTYVGEPLKIGATRLEGYEHKVWNGARWVAPDDRIWRLLAARQALKKLPELAAEGALATIDAMLLA